MSIITLQYVMGYLEYLSHFVFYIPLVLLVFSLNVIMLRWDLLL